MTKEELIKNQFPNDEFLQSGVLQIVDKCVAELEKENAELKTKKIPQLERKIASIRGAHSVDCKKLNARIEQIKRLKEENAELRKVAEFQQSSNMSRHFENKKLKECLAVGSTFNKALNSMNKNLEEERDKYRNMVFDKNDQLTKAKEIIGDLLSCLYSVEYDRISDLEEAEQFLKEVSE